MSVHLVSRAVALALVASMAAGPASGARASTAAVESDGASERKDAAAALRAQGLELGYNLDHAEALEAFEEAIAVDPDDPTAYRLAAGTAWVALLFKQGTITVADYLGQARTTVARPVPDAELDARFHSFLDRSLALSERQLRSNPRDAAAHYHVGAAFGFVAFTPQRSTAACSAASAPRGAPIAS